LTDPRRVEAASDRSFERSRFADLRATANELKCRKRIGTVHIDQRSSCWRTTPPTGWPREKDIPCCPLG
jgi:hypothetical protein